MLAVSFFLLIFSSLVWLILSFRLVADNLGGTSLFNAGMPEISASLAIICLPIFLAWLVFGYACQYLHNRNTSLMMLKLFGQMKKNQDYSDLIARVMIETEQQIKDGFMLGRFDLLVADMNELLAEIIKDCKIASSEQIERLWNKVQNGGKWSFGKVIIEVNNAQPNFQMRIYEKANRDLMLGGALMEFCARYQSVVSLLEKHDHDKTFLNIIETGIMGKVFSILAPISDEIRRSRENAAAFTQQRQSFRAQQQESKPEETSPQTSMNNDAFWNEKPKKSILDKVPFLKKKPEPDEVSYEKDSFSRALERSFGQEHSNEPQLSAYSETESDIQEPKFEISMAEEDLPHEELSRTQQQLNTLKKEWETMAAPAPISRPDIEEKDDDFAYPFGGWTDEENYNK